MLFLTLLAGLTPAVYASTGNGSKVEITFTQKKRKLRRWTTGWQWHKSDTTDSESHTNELTVLPGTIVKLKLASLPDRQSYYIAQDGGLGQKLQDLTIDTSGDGQRTYHFDIWKRGDGKKKKDRRKSGGLFANRSGGLFANRSFTLRVDATDPIDSKKKAGKDSKKKGTDSKSNSGGGHPNTTVEANEEAAPEGGDETSRSESADTPDDDDEDILKKLLGILADYWWVLAIVVGTIVVAVILCCMCKSSPVPYLEDIEQGHGRY